MPSSNVANDETDPRRGTPTMAHFQPPEWTEVKYSMN